MAVFHRGCLDQGARCRRCDRSPASRHLHAIYDKRIARVSINVRVDAAIYAHERSVAIEDSLYSGICTRRTVGRGSAVLWRKNRS